ncbi:hypothetical protein OHA25_07845 [Nonomuraea sp. NBC_00507]|uniref:hypothetical protein n=1 Tax=Nonomuraea sp. NBC_00507 TaxID=2976002 RepID=UPI002E18DE9E
MSDVYAAISMSLDGFIAAPGDCAERQLGHGGEVLHRWMGSGDRRQVGILAELFDRLGALVVGRRGFDISEKA